MVVVIKHWNNRINPIWIQCSCWYQGCSNDGRGGANEVTEDVVLEAIMFGHEAIKELCIKQDEMREAIGVERLKSLCSNLERGNR